VDQTLQGERRTDRMSLIGGMLMSASPENKNPTSMNVERQDRPPEDLDRATHTKEGRKVLGINLLMFFPVVILGIIALAVIIYYLV